MKKRRNKKTGTMGATTTSKDWDFGPVSGKGGKTQNSLIGDTMIHREMKEQKQN
jgi:hypothetical protein